MFHYYFLLGLRSLRRNPALTALMVLTLAIGVAASVSTLTILHVMSGDPIPHKSERLLVPVLDNGSVDTWVPGSRPFDDQLSYRDASNLMASKQGVRRTVLYGVSAPIEPERKDLGAISANGVAPSRDFFAMFEAPFLYGHSWSEQEDAAGADVVVLSRPLAEKLYGSVDPTGRRLQMWGRSYQVIGVLDDWLPLPRYYRLIGGGGAFGKEDEFVVPFSSAIRHQTGHSGSMSCSNNTAPGFQAVLDSECTWMQVWIELGSARERAALQDYLDAYSVEQRKLGRMLRKAPNGLYNVMEWLEYRKVVGNDNRLTAWLAFGFLLLCLVNTVGLLLAKFSVRAAEVGIRRALGASQREIFRQFLIESGVIGLAGGLLGLLLAYGALALIAMQSKKLAVVAHMDLTMLAATFVMAIAAALLAGLLPTWRACQVTPAMQLKSQ
ncbi:ABC transporter permease [Oxalobacteraceae bacterium]|nr:ABC transporter permease [Oxalobacteraceae bacterium]